MNSPGLPTKAELRRWLAAALERDAAITVRFVGAAEGRALNRAYRGRDYATNVLSFDYGDDGRGQILAGDIVLCAPVLRREARAQGKALPRMSRTWRCTACCTCRDTITRARARPRAWRRWNRGSWRDSGLRTPTPATRDEQMRW